MDELAQVKGVAAAAIGAFSILMEIVGVERDPETIRLLAKCCGEALEREIRRLDPVRSKAADEAIALKAMFQRSPKKTKEGCR